jgi:peptidoglycan/LPS O-acetylase OafA/YrhL
LAVAAAGPLARLLLAMVSHTGLLPLNPRMDLFIYVLPFSHVDAFATGGYFALYGKGRRGLSFWVVLLLVILLGVTTGWLSTSRISWRGFGYGPFMQDSYKYLWGYSLVNCLFASMLVQIRRRALMPRFFENSFLVYLGTISYGLYVFHFPVLWVVWRTGRAFSDTTQTLTALLLTGVISMLSYELMEKRLINLKDRYFARTSSPDPKGLWARP